MNDIALSTGAPPARRQNFGVETRQSAEATTAAALVAAFVKRAQDEGRNWDDIRIYLLRRCRTPEFARSTRTFYLKPIGRGVEGLGIGFVEELLQAMRHIYRRATMLFEEAEFEVWQAYLFDGVANAPLEMQFRVSKAVERSKPNDDGSFLSVRKNSKNANVFSVIGTEDDMMNMRASARSKAWRQLGLMLIPGDLKDECVRAIRETRRDEAAKDPDGERKRLADAFADMGVKPSQLAQYLGHDLGNCTPGELATLRDVYSGIREGDETWQTVMEARNAERDEKDDEKKDEPQQPGTGSTAAETAKERLRARRAGNTPKPPAAAPTGAPDGPAGASSTVPPGDALFIDEQEGPSAEALRDKLMKAADKDSAAEVIDLARHLPKEDYDSLVELLDQRFPEE